MFTSTQLFTGIAVMFTGIIADDRGFDRWIIFPEEFQQVKTDPAAKENIHEYNIGLSLHNDAYCFAVGTGLEYDPDVLDFIQETDDLINDQ
jgi:hypothetical protein